MREKWTPLRSPTLRDIQARTRGYIPHWELPGATYNITFRLADSLPKHVLERLAIEKTRIAALLSRSDVTRIEKSQLWIDFSMMVDEYLDRGYGSCGLREPAAASIVSETILHFAGDRYDLLAWAVMPNHVHIVFRPLDGWTLARLLHSIKSYTSKEINKVLGTKGQNWQEEYFDRIVRDERDLAQSVEYVARNPLKARLENWPWVWPKVE